MGEHSPGNTSAHAGARRPIASSTVRLLHGQVSGAVRRRAISKSARRPVSRRAGAICPIRGQSCKFQTFALAATLDYLMGEFNGGCTAADGCREQPLIAVILQEGNGYRAQRRPTSEAKWDVRWSELLGGNVSDGHIELNGKGAPSRYGTPRANVATGC